MFLQSIFTKENLIVADVMDDLIAKLANKTQGSMLYASYIIDIIRQRYKLNDNQPISHIMDIDAIPDSLYDYFMHEFDNIPGLAGKSTVLRVLKLILISRQPIALETISSYLDIPLIDVERAQKSLCKFCSIIEGT
jgi:hypothetical protein